MNNKSPKISVIMSVYNGGQYLNEAIDSILNQTFTDFEFIIIDDGSTDDSAEIIKSYDDERIIIIQQENKGLAAALNEGIKIARGKYIARMDVDDIALLLRLEKQMSFLDGNKDCVIVGSSAIVIDRKGEFLFNSKMPTEWEEIKRNLPYHSPFYHSSVMFRKEVCITCGGYYEKIGQHIEDIILWNKLSIYGELRNLRDSLIKYRLVPNAITNRDKKTRKVLGQLLLNILENGDMNQNDLIRLKIVTKKKSQRWKLSNYFLRIGAIYLFKRNNLSKKAIINFIKAILNYPINYRAWFFMFLGVVSCFNKKIIGVWKRYRNIA